MTCPSDDAAVLMFLSGIIAGVGLALLCVYLDRAS